MALGSPPRERIVKVSPKDPCTVCGHGDWCGYTSRVRLCMRVPSDRKAANGAYIHPWEDGENHEPMSPILHTSQPRAPLARRDRAYRELLSTLTLTGEHREDLRRRGLTEEEIAAAGYRTSPSGDRLAIAQSVAAALGTDALLGIPGFFQAQRGGWVLGGKPGILIPVRDQEGRIQGLQVRVADRDAEGGRYRWLSSNAKPGGASSGVPMHVARPVGGLRQELVWVTEGPLKADVSAHYLGATVLGVAGVFNWHDVPKFVQPLSRSGAPAQVVVAYDADAQDNAQVAESRKALVSALLAVHAVVSLAIWPMSQGKGLDDVLKSGGRVRLYRL